MADTPARLRLQSIALGWQAAEADRRHEAKAARLRAEAQARKDVAFHAEFGVHRPAQVTTREDEERAEREHAAMVEAQRRYEEGER